MGVQICSSVVFAHRPWITLVNYIITQTFSQLRWTARPKLNMYVDPSRDLAIRAHLSRYPYNQSDQVVKVIGGMNAYDGDFTVESIGLCLGFIEYLFVHDGWSLFSPPSVSLYVSIYPRNFMNVWMQQKVFNLYGYQIFVRYFCLTDRNRRYK